MYISKETVRDSVEQLFGTAGHLLKIWFVLKHMGLDDKGGTVDIDTANSTPSLNRLFGCGAPDGTLYVPFGHTARFVQMKKDASRSIIQTNIQRWSSSGSVVTCDPTTYLDINEMPDGKLRVSTRRNYPLGLGHGESGFAINEESRVTIPLGAFAVWYGRRTNITDDTAPLQFLINEMLSELNISTAERNLLFIDHPITLKLAHTPISDEDLFEICGRMMADKIIPVVKVIQEDLATHQRKVRSMISSTDVPTWLRSSPEEDLKQLVSAGATSVLLFGPPRTGKTRAIDAQINRDHPLRETIQIHDGWGYDNLIQGLKPDESGNWNWQSGPLKRAIETGKKYIVLEEINRTQISQSLGEVFSLIEDGYRGSSYQITLRDGKPFYIPEDVVFFMTMNTLDKSTEDIDDALLGRISSIEFPPRVEDLNEMLSGKSLTEHLRAALTEIYAEILTVYPLGHGYFAQLKPNASNVDAINYYKVRIRPVLRNYFGDLKEDELVKIDNLVDQELNR